VRPGGGGLGRGGSVENPRPADRLECPGPAAAVREIGHQVSGLGAVTVPDDRVNPPAGGVEVNAAEAEATLDRAFDAANALDLR